MPYIGHNPTQAGSFVLLDDIDSGFDGSDVTFTLQIGGVDITPTADNLLIILDGVVQHSPEAYTVSGSTLTFTAAPADGQEFYGMLMGQSASVGQGSVGADELAVTGDGSANQLLSSDADGTMTWKDGSLSTTSATGDLIYRNSSGILARLAVGSAGQVLTVASGIPAWETDVESYLPLSGGTMSGALNMNSQNITNGGSIAGTFTGNLTGNVSGNVTGNTSGTAATVTGGAQSNITSLGTLTGLTVSSGSSSTTSTISADRNAYLNITATDVNNNGLAKITLSAGNAADSSSYSAIQYQNPNYSNTAGNRLLFLRGSGATVLTLDGSGNSIFGGSIYLPSGGRIHLTGSTTNPAVDGGYGIENNHGYFDTLNSGADSDPLELVYSRGTHVRIGTGAYGSKALYASALYQNGAQVIATDGGTITTSSAPGLTVDVGLPSSANREIVRFAAASARPICLGWIDSGSKMTMFTPGTHSIVLGAGTIGTNHLEIASTGAATFAGTVLISQSGSETPLHIKNTNTGGGQNAYLTIENDGGGDSYLNFLQGSSNGYIKYTDEGDMIFQTAGMNDRLSIVSSGAKFEDRVAINCSINAQNMLHIETTTTDSYTAADFNDNSVLGLRSVGGSGYYTGIQFTNSYGNYEKFFGSVQTSANTADIVWQGYDRGAGVYKEYMRIEEGGDVGIGTDSPTSIGGGYTTIGLNGANGSGISLQKAGSIRGYIYATNTDVYLQSANNNKVRISPNGSSETVWDTSGNVRFPKQVGVGNSTGFPISAGTPQLHLNTNHTSTQACQMLMEAEFITVTNGNTATVTIPGTGSLFFIQQDAGGNGGYASALFYGNYSSITSAGDTTLLSDESSEFSSTKDTSNRTNVYIEGYTNNIIIQNNRGTTKKYTVQIIAVTGQ